MSLLTVYNLALSMAREASVSSTTDTTDDRVVHLNTVYADRVRSLLSLADWPFVRKDIPLEENADVFTDYGNAVDSGWTYQYDRPACLAVRFIYQEGYAHRTWEFEETTVEDLAATPDIVLTRVIRTHCPPNDAPGRPFARITENRDQTVAANIDVWTPLFLDCVTQTLAAGVLMRFSKNPGTFQLAAQMTQLAVTTARMYAAGLDTQIEHESHYLQARR